MATPAFIPRNDGEGQIGLISQRWSGAWFKGSVNSRGQPVTLKYYVSGSAQRYALSGYSSDTIPNYGDLVYQVAPTALYAVVDPTNLGNESGYAQIGSSFTGITVIVPSGSGYNDLFGIFIFNNSGVKQWAMTPNQVIGYDQSGNQALFLSSSGSGNFANDIVARNFFGNFIGNGSGLTGLHITGVNSIIASGATLTGNIFLSGSGNNFVLVSGNNITIYCPVGGSGGSIQFNSTGLLNGITSFRYETGVPGFGITVSGQMRGLFDLNKNVTGSGVLATPTGISVSGSGSGPYSNTCVYGIYSFVTFSGVNYYSTTYASGSGNVGASKNNVITWSAATMMSGFPQVSGYLISGISGSTGLFQTSSTSFIDSGVNNFSGFQYITGLLYPTYYGVDLMVDYLSNLLVNQGWIYIHGYPVVTKNQLSGLMSGMGRTVVLCSAYTPTSTGADAAEVPLPYALDGVTTQTWYMRRATFRVQTTGGSPSVNFEMSTGTGVFNPVLITGITLASGAYESSVTGLLATMSGGWKLRFNPQALGSASNWTITAEIATL